MGKANHYVGQRIQFFRKLKGFTQQQLADAIGKSKATVSKYEKSEISIDVETLNDISQVLGISLAQLTNYTEPGTDLRRSHLGQGAFATADTIYLYQFDGSRMHMRESVLRILPGSEQNRAELYMDVDIGDDNYQNCASFYEGTVEYHSTVITFVLRNQCNDAEQLMIYLNTPMGREQETPGMLCGLSHQNLQPVAIRCIFSVHRMKLDDELRHQLTLSRQELHNVRRLNRFTVPAALHETAEG